MFSLDKIVISPLFLVKKMGKLVQEPAPKMLSPKTRGEEGGGRRGRKKKKTHINATLIQEQNVTVS